MQRRRTIQDTAVANTVAWVSRIGAAGQAYNEQKILTPVTQLSLLIYLEIAPLPEQLNGNKGR